MILNTDWVNIEIREEIRRYLKTNEKENTMAQNLWDSENSPKIEIYSSTGVSQKTRYISNNLTFYLKELEEQQTKPKVSRSKEIIKIREEINEIV